jgi:hypothetical protein
VVRFDEFQILECEMSLGMEDFSRVKAQVLGAQIATFLLEAANHNAFKSTHFLWVDPGTNSPPRSKPQSLRFIFGALFPSQVLSNAINHLSNSRSVARPKYARNHVMDCRCLSRWGQGIEAVVPEMAQPRYNINLDGEQ